LKKEIAYFLGSIFFILILSGFVFSHSFEEPLPTRNCVPVKIDSLSFENLLWMFQQQDTLADYAVDQNLILGIKKPDHTVVFKRFGQNHLDLDSLNKFDLYALRLIHQHSEIASFWKHILQPEIESFAIKKDSLTNIFPPKPYRLRFVSENRSLSKQVELQQKGKSKIRLSLHNFGLAADVGLYRKGRYVRRGEIYSRMGNKSKDLGLFWGGDFMGFPDPGHVQAFRNSAALIEKYPILGFEFEKFKVSYEKTYVKQFKAGRGALVEDTKSLLAQLNQLRMDQICACSAAIMPSNDMETKSLLDGFLTQPQAVVYANLIENWVYIQKGSSGYFYSLGKWKQSFQAFE
jgi:hypothetical protein